jgi:hypothetical protein
MQEVTRRQARIVMAKIEPMLGYLTRLRRRMGSRGFTQDDPLYSLVQHAEQAVQRLRDDLRAREVVELKVAETPERPIEVNVESPRTLEMRERMRRDRSWR